MKTKILKKIFDYTKEKEKLVESLKNKPTIREKLNIWYDCYDIDIRIDELKQILNLIK